MQRSARSSETQGTAQSCETPSHRIPCYGMRKYSHLINPIEAGKAEMFQAGPQGVRSARPGRARESFALVQEGSFAKAVCEVLATASR